MRGCTIIKHAKAWLAGWSSNVPFQHKYGYIRDER